MPSSRPSTLHEGSRAANDAAGLELQAGSSAQAFQKQIGEVATVVQEGEAICGNLPAYKSHALDAKSRDWIVTDPPAPMTLLMTKWEIATVAFVHDFTTWPVTQSVLCRGFMVRLKISERYVSRYL